MCWHIGAAFRLNCCGNILIGLGIHRVCVCDADLAGHAPGLVSLLHSAQFSGGEGAVGKRLVVCGCGVDFIELFRDGSGVGLVYGQHWLPSCASFEREDTVLSLAGGDGWPGRFADTW